MSWPARPVIHEVNTWPWLHDLGVRAGRTVTLVDVPADAWDSVCVPGMKYSGCSSVQGWSGAT